MISPMDAPQVVFDDLGSVRRPATLPNCDGCGRFTSKPTERTWCTGGNAEGIHACYSELLCPKCAEKRPA